ncbi:MAG: hypothetical protein CW691_05920 [Candidatus Bathyarchaeum sp.]|nr:MAG: hypothetical protein CW691_05920 [Candidatus Bathyarchaeum sp.]
MLACARKHHCHTASTVGKKLESKKQLQKQAFLWCRKTHHTHIKRQKPKAKHPKLLVTTSHNQLQPPTDE